MNSVPEKQAGAGAGAPLTERQYLIPFILITSLFFLWAFGVNLNDVLIPHFKDAFRLSDLQSSLIQAAFFGGYFLAALPAGWLMERIGYKQGILTGLAICAAGAVLFIPAESLGYNFYLFALFVLAYGQAFLEVGANPYVTLLGPTSSSERRLNLAQSFNSVGAVLTPIIGKAFILSNSSTSETQVKSVTPVYVVIAGTFAVVALLIALTKLPESAAASDSPVGGPQPKLRDVLRFGHLTKGVLAQFLYVGAQVGVGSFIIRFTKYLVPGTGNQDASDYVKFHLLGFMIGRFAGPVLMKYVAPSRLLAVFAGLAGICAAVSLSASGIAPVWGLVLIGFFHSIMFPTIFALSIKRLGPYTKLGSSLLVMSIIGGALFPIAMGKVSDLTNIRTAFCIPLLCYLYIAYYGIWGSKPAGEAVTA